MDFVNRNFSGTLKIIITVFAVFVFIRVLPWIVAIGVIAWGINKSVKHINTLIRVKKNNKQEKVNVKDDEYNHDSAFDFSGKKIIDVDYEEIKK
jgi:hypothetical protein